MNPDRCAVTQMALPRPRVAEQKTETPVADGLSTGLEASPRVPDQRVSLGAGSAGDAPPLRSLLLLGYCDTKLGWVTKEKARAFGDGPRQGGRLTAPFDTVH